MENQNEYSITECERFGEQDRTGIPRRKCGQCKDRIRCDSIREKKTPTEIKQPSKSIPLKRRKHNRKNLSDGLLSRRRESEIRQDENERELRKQRIADKDLNIEFITIIESRIVEAEDSVENYTDVDIQQNELFLARCKAVKKLTKELQKAQAHILQNYEDESTYSREGLFPMKWMKDNKKIAAQIKKYPLLSDLLNFFYDRTRYTRGQELKRMAELNDKVIDWDQVPEGRFHLGDIVASFVADDKFYNELERTFQRKRITFQKYLQAMSKAKFIHKAGQVGQYGGFLYIDGYFKQSKDNTFRKHPFLINNADYRDALRDFQIK